jgi:REP element-mobilizing transposase RayT
MSYTNLNYHIVFGTKDRRPSIGAELLPRMMKYLGGIIRELDGCMIEANGPEDHLHIVAALGPGLAVSDFLRTIKTNSSKWVHDTYAGKGDFGWQDGYSAFSASHSQLSAAVEYVRGQQAHHQKMTFEQELIALLKRHEIKFDPKYVVA